MQYYDKQGLPPAALTNGGRRVFTEADAAKLRKVLLLKSLRLKLADIRSLLESDVSATVLRDILEVQDARLAAELEERTQPRARKVACTHCGTKDWCAEVAREGLKTQEAI